MKLKTETGSAAGPVLQSGLYSSLPHKYYEYFGSMSFQIKTRSSP